MGWFVVFVVFVSVFFAGFSFKSLFLYVILSSITFGLTFLFLTNEWGLDWLFEGLFKIVELFGVGVPLRLENRISCSSFYTSGGFRSLDEIPKPLEECLKKLIANIIRDFIRTWYQNVGVGEHFISEARESLEMLCLEGYRRASQIDSHYLIEQVIVVFHGHLERFNKAMAVVKAKDPKLRLSISSSQLLCQTYESQLASNPPSLSNPAAEINYLRNVIDSLLASMIPKDTFSCDTGRFILREILTVRVMEPLVGLLTDPDWISQAVIEVLSDGEDRDVNKAGAATSDLVMEGSDDSGNGDDPVLSDDTPPLPVMANTTTTTTATAHVKLQKEEIVNVLRKESKDSVEDVGERIEIMSPRTCEESADFHWSVSSERQPPVGESQHDNTESFLVISVEEDRENNTEEESPDRQNWSTEVVPPSSVENLTSCSLSSSWGFCPPSQDESFNTQSFENMKETLSKLDSNAAVGTKLEEFGHNLKELSCCHNFEESGDTYQPTMSMVAQKGSSDEDSDIHVTGEEPWPRVRTRSLSLPGRDEMFENKMAPHAPRTELSRSVSVPSKLSFADFNDYDLEEFSSPVSPRRLHSSWMYNTSFCSSSDSFKSISSEEDLLDSYIERGEEAVEHCEDFDSSRGSSHSTRHRITKQASFEESHERRTSDSSTEDLAESKDVPSPFNKDRFRAEKMALQNRKESSELDDIKESSWEAVDKSHDPNEDTISRRKRLRLGFGTHATESFSDAFLSAGKKLVSNFKPPFKFDSLSSSSEKSKEASFTSEGESLDHSSGSQQRIAPKKQSLDAGRARAATYSPVGARRLSRSDAMIQESMESDGEACYGTPREELVQEIADSSMRGTVDGRNLSSVKRMHPSQLISIPSTVIALETTWEPGRNKYTLYKIEYDIRIWHEVYSAAIKQAKSEAKKEQMKRKLYAATESEPQDEDISLDVIKRRVARKRMIHRRYREFMELHNRLTGGKLAVHMKDILKPNRKYNLPFGRLDPHVVEGRRELLQYYLGSLISKPALRDSEDLKQFLGVTGGEQVSFIKPSVAQIVSQSVHVPRVDKMLSRQMTKVIDTIKTAFDSVEEEENTSEEFSTATSENATVPWKLACNQDVPDGKLETNFIQENTFTPMYYSAFIAARDAFILPTPPSPIHSLSEEKQENGDEQDGLPLWGKKWENKVTPSDSEEETVGFESSHHQSLGPRTAGDGSDNPDDPVAVSSDTKAVLSGCQQREQSGAIFNKYLDNTQSSTVTVTHKPLGLSVSQPAPRSKSMEGISTAAPNIKFQFKPQKILEAAKRIGQGSKTETLENPDTVSSVKEKKQGTLKKFLKETSIPVLSGNSKKQNVAAAVGLCTERAHNTKQLPLRPEVPCAASEMDQPSNLDDGSFVDRASAMSDLQCPLSDAILNLLCELLKERRSWLTVDRVQQAFTATLGGLFEWHIQSGIDDITSDECWALYLDKLNEAIWPGGKLLEDADKPKTEIEKARTRKEAAQALMNAFPGFIMLLFGPRVYHQTAVNIIDSMQYPHINKILLYTLLELILSEFVPEIHETLQFFRLLTTQK